MITDDKRQYLGSYLWQDKKKRKTHLVFSNYEDVGRDQSRTGPVTSLFFDGNRLWTGFEKNGFIIRDITTGNVLRRELNPGESINGFYRQGNNRVLAVTTNNILIYGIRVFLSDISEAYPSADNALFRDVKLKCLLEGQDNTMWIGTEDGLQVLKVGNHGHTWKRLIWDGYDSIRLGAIYDITAADEGSLWLGTENGLILFNTRDDIAYKYTPYDQNLLNTEVKKVFRIVPRSPGILWLATSGGVYSFDVTQRRFSALSNNLLMNTSVGTLNFDRFGNMWIGTDRGLFYYVPSTESYLLFDHEDGLLNYSYHASASDMSDFVYFCGVRGVSSVAVAGPEPGGNFHNVVITGVSRLENEGYVEIYCPVPTL